MSREFWDSQFKFSAVLPDFAMCLEDLAKRSDDFAQARSFERLTYGDHPRQWVETTRGLAQSDVVPVIIHGGYWRALEAETHRAMMAGFLEHAGTVANLEYRLMPSVRLKEIVADVAAGLVALLNSKPSARLLLVGHSAGAHLALSALNTPAVARSVTGVIAISGIYELWPVTRSFLQDELSLTSAEVTDFTFDPDRSRPPVLYITGANETHEFQRQSARMTREVKTAWQQVQGTHHMNVPLAATAPQAVAKSLATLAELEAKT